MTARRARSVAIVAAAGAWMAFVAAHAFRLPTDSLDLIDRNFDQLPFAMAAVRRALRALGACALVYLAAWQAGRIVLVRAEDLFTSTLERVHVTLAIGVAALSALLFALGVVGLYRPAAAVLVVVAAAASRPSEVKAILSSAGAAVRFRRPPPGADTVYAACSLLALACALVAALAPEIEYDALWYHLWLPAQWLAAGRPVDFIDEFISLYPLGWDLLNGPALAVGGPIGAKLLHFVCLPLTASAATLLARQTAPRVSGSLVFALTAVAPTMMWEGSTAYVDLALAWLATVAVVCVFRYQKEGDRRWLLVAGVVFGATLSTKHLGLIVLAIAAAGVAAMPPARHRSRLGGFPAAVLMAVVALALASPWYARAWSAARNPFFPEMTAIFGASPPERWSAETDVDLARFKAHFGAGRGPAAMLRLPWDITTHGAAFGGALGPAFLMLAPLAVFARRRRVLALLAGGCLMYVAVWASPVGSLQLRFLIPLVPALAVLAAAGGAVLTDHADRLRPGLSAVAVAAIAVLMVMMLPPLTEWQERDRRGWDGWLTHVLRALPVAVVVGAEAEEEYLARTVPAYRAWRFLDEQTPPDAKVLTFAGGDHLYSHRARLWSDAAPSYAAIWNVPAEQEDVALRELRRLGVTHVLLDRRRLEEPRLRHQAIVSERMRSCCLVQLYEDQRMTVFRLDGPGHPAGGSTIPRR